MRSPTIEDVLGIGQTKLGFFHEWQLKLQELEEAHAESERRRLANAAILEAIPDLMMVIDEDSRIISVNHVVEGLFPERELLGAHCHKLLRGRASPCPDCPALRCLAQGGAVRDNSIFSINGDNLHFDIVAVPLPPPSGAPRAALLFLRDVTREKQLLAQMCQAEKMASIGRLAAGVAHEINNPLTAVAGFAEGIRRRLPRLEEALAAAGVGENGPTAGILADLAEYSHTILHECGRCRDIVQALAKFSRPLPSRKPVRLDLLIEETLSLLRHNLKQYERVLFCLDLDDTLPQLWLNDTQVRQVLLNLITNALDALRESTAGAEDAETGEPAGTEGTITIRTGRDGDAVLLQVEDTGAGIPEQHRHTVFEPFFTTKPKGLGLGLAVCYSVVRAHGGEISLSGGPDGKTRVTVRLPIQQQPDAARNFSADRPAAETHELEP